MVILKFAFLLCLKGGLHPGETSGTAPRRSDRSFGPDFGGNGGREGDGVFIPVPNVVIGEKEAKPSVSVSNVVTV